MDSARQILAREHFSSPNGRRTKEVNMIQKVFSRATILFVLLTGIVALQTGPKLANAGDGYSSGATNPNDLPAGARAKVQADWPGWAVDSSTLVSNLLSCTVQAHNKTSGTRATFTVYVTARVERGRTIYYETGCSGPQ